SETQRMAIHSDPAFLAGDYADQAPPIAGLGAARAIAMMTYRSARMFEQRHAGVAVAPQSGKEGHSSDSVREWLHHHGRHFVGRFDANVYLSLIDAMDRHDIGWKRGGVEAALNGIRQPAIVISISSDWLYPPSEQREIAEGLSQAKYVEIDSEQGHDGFLIDAAMLEPHLTRFHEVQR
ncbi:alpha/beta fold hydrolase, partial [Roseateles sp. P5_E1]